MIIVGMGLESFGFFFEKMLKNVIFEIVEGFGLVFNFIFDEGEGSVHFSLSC